MRFKQTLVPLRQSAIMLFHHLLDMVFSILIFVRRSRISLSLLVWPMCVLGSTSLLGRLTMTQAAQNAYISPASLQIDPAEYRSRTGRGLFEGFPRTYISYGKIETLAGEIQEMIKRMRNDLVDDGGDVAEMVAEDCVEGVIHDICMFDWFEPERTGCFDRMGR